MSDAVTGAASASPSGPEVAPGGGAELAPDAEVVIAPPAMRTAAPATTRQARLPETKALRLKLDMVIPHCCLGGDRGRIARSCGRGTAALPGAGARPWIILPVERSPAWALRVQVGPENRKRSTNHHRRETGGQGVTRPFPHPSRDFTFIA
ncbi:hypothetical protein Skr01_49940 [Sphaerisporangium krabiense]|nr:hypothetical protein Skr01_49940 [Sphaerisporangium krabiense]